MRVLSERVPVKVWASDLEAEAEKQVRNMGNMPFIYKHVAVMPDAHAGKGSTVGTVIATKGAIIPAAVGVDIGCGMSAVKLPFPTAYFGDSLRDLRNAIEAVVPVGFNEHANVAAHIDETLGGIRGGLSGAVNINLDKTARQVGSLGGGNHFIEICEDLAGGAWVVVHSGSRNVGNVLAKVHIESAKDMMKRYFIDLPDPDLAFLAQNTQEFKAYIKDLHWAQAYAKINRAEIMARVLACVAEEVWGKHGVAPFKAELEIDCHHNYTAMENHFGQNVWITRKGAVSARAGEWGIIPGSMGTKSYIVKGLGNADSFCSCSHGAGRRMSRTKAREQFSVADLAIQTAGVECRKDDGVLDEIPGAYKDIDQVMEDQKDLVTPVYQLKQILCVKG